MNSHQQRDTYGKQGLFRLVVEGVHSHKDTKAAANGGHGHKDSFRDAPKLSFSPALIDKHKQQPCCIHYNEVWDKQFHKFSFLEGIQ